VKIRTKTQTKDTLLGIRPMQLMAVASPHIGPGGDSFQDCGYDYGSKNGAALYGRLEPILDLRLAFWKWIYLLGVGGLCGW
jgi:hypothetical protein